MPIRKVMKANEAAAWAAKLAKPKVIAAFPITPSTLIPEKISEFVANGELDAEFIKVESEHSAISACVGAAAAGVRTFTATASQGLALMHEILFIAAGMRLPIVMAIGNRALSAPINIWNDWQDTISQRDTGWMQFYAENNQEALDLILIAYKVAEDERVLLPAMVGFDAFILTHTVEPVEIPDQEVVDEFLGEYEPKHAYIDPARPITQGSLAFPAHYMESRYTVWEAMERAKKVIDEAFAEFEKKFGRKYQKIEEYKTEDADIIFVTMGSLAGTLKEWIDKKREEGYKVGAAKITVYRPFPVEEIRELAKKAKVLAFLEKNITIGLYGAVFTDASAALINESEKPLMVDFIVGLGGRDVTFNQLDEALEIAEKALKEGKVENPINWIGLRWELVK
ncbi:pyruvate ferredoxin oxidoreductase [Pyrococcus furiosus DSM 3638]|uniref:Pyruvate synthase subunit PorA n=3 Tax=Pyrococcus furiosus TaxID=2261 RepID=PORA_PYRFU|nr:MULTISPECIES: pyruvate synthase subunit PorA [Pyrococcus]Q51804.2 RecName: Full=Pyruvate synthase subunit PorA; AltName: Full=Pyruvate oxidoreductase alpha chain; Short=POR; AltName: Full=Pyruvic-ferredoxin oxidoreductase subunit alpha [Pyrococcus furiosus DSM 3638]AAL81090.1 pyruvate ferredoxin oxidoreductase subunit alpha-2 [Pyrococcus furiosus DSM 3638]AFN03761.1 pyruvate ferredoxin oxidoreductase subunit alpha [Pyrococcus furiosus COM1]MDK2869818.1 pyruvate ferredoxin oxidoreductase alph